MKGYYFLSKHPKFEIEFPTDGSKPPSKHACTIRRNQVNVDAIKEDIIPETANTFVRLPSRNAHPPGREQSKRVNAINFTVDKTTEKALVPTGYSSVEKLWEKIKNWIEQTKTQMKDKQSSHDTNSISHLQELL
jgi:hypothetical protein